MTVIRLDIAYDGSRFHGWARQPRLRTVEGALADVLGRVLGAPPKFSVAGRTDAGVHARGQVASFVVPQGVTTARADPQAILRAVNGRLAPEVVITRARAAPEGFDARFSARSREYRYRIDLGPVPDPFTAPFVWHRPCDLRLGAMRRAASLLVGEHDFASFGRAPKEGGGTVRELQRLAISRGGDRIEIVARANAFIQQMVRSLVGTLVEVGEGRIDPNALPSILAARDRSAAGMVAPPHGLTLEQVRYRAR